MKKKYFFTLILFNFLFTSSKADHTAGADLGYVCLGANKYQVNLNIYSDCIGSQPNAQQTISFSSPCGSLPSIQIDLMNAGGTEISQLCPSQINNSTCNGGTLPGMRVYQYTGTVTIIPVCNSWTISWWTCCRNATIINLQNSNSGMYLETTLNNTSFCNTSSSFKAPPIPYICVNQPVDYNFGATDSDNDSLYFSLVSAMVVGPSNLAYSSGYSATAPIPGIVLDPHTGQLTFTPVTIGSFVVVVLVKEYNSNGDLAGSSKRDIQFVVQNCSNTIPDPGGTVLNIVNATKTGAYSIEVCEGSSFTFKTAYTDADAGDVLTISSDITTWFPGATITSTGSNPKVAVFSWIPPPGSANTINTFNVIIDDGSCPVPGRQQFSYTIKVLPPCFKDTSMLFIPNVFTPGGAHPVFLISSYGIISYSIRIFNRWGDNVFESHDATIHWNGNNVSDGTYYYVIRATGIDKKEYDEKGFVQRIGMR